MLVIINDKTNELFLYLIKTDFKIFKLSLENYNYYQLYHLLFDIKTDVNVGGNTDIYMYRPH